MIDKAADYSSRENGRVRRFGSVVGLRPEAEARYRELHASPWPEVIERLRRSNIRNYSIFIAELGGRKYLFSYFEYVGDDFDADSRAIAADPATNAWWRETAPCQIAVSGEDAERNPGSPWTDLVPVFFME